MGLFDSFHLTDDSVPLLSGDGNLVRELQTKDLDSSMDDYYIRDSRVYTRRRTSEETLVPVDDTRFLLRRDAECVLSAMNATLKVYGEDTDDEPILFESVPPAWGGDIVREEKNFCNFEITVRDGVVTSHRVLDAPPREERIRNMRANGVSVIPDDDRVAVRHRLLKEQSRTPK